MAAVKSIVRSLLKPIFFKLLNENIYLWLQYRAKVRDIDGRLVEEDEAALLPYFVKEDSVVLDIGANYGYYTIPLGQLCSKGVVYAFEPIPPTFSVLEKIVKHYNLNNVRLYKKGVGETNAIVQFEAPIQDAGFISAGQAHMKGRHNELSEKRIYYPWENNRIYDCQIISVDKEFFDFKRLDFIKIDIEGAELFAFKGMVNTIKRLKPVILIEICKFWLTGFGITANDISNFISSIDYNIYYYNKTEKKLIFVPSLTDDTRYNYIDEKNLTPYAPNYILIHKEQIKQFDKLIKSY